MPNEFHFISGLPRSGSTLLCALLKQNPKFSAGMTSPVASFISPLMQKMSGATEFAVFFDDERRRTILRSVFNGYYAHVPEGSTVFDTNRTWTGKAALVKDLYPKSRIICCVREVGWIIDSIERMLRKNPQQLSRVFNYQPGTSVYGRVELLMNSESGLIGLPWGSFREAWFSEFAKQLIVVTYERLTKDPKGTMKRLYEELEQNWFEHDFNHVVYDEPDYDALLGMPGMHKVQEKVEYKERKSCIPPDLLSKYEHLSFWTNPKLNTHGVIIL